MKVDKVPVCDPIEKLITILIEKNYIMKESRISDFHFHELYFKMQSLIKNSIDDIEIDKIKRVDSTTFSCTCHWSIVELYYENIKI